MTTQATPYAFPILRKLDESQRAADRAREAQLEAAFNDAVARGIAEGIARGQHDARVEAQQLLEQSHREGIERGHADGLAEMQEAAAALRDALARFQVQCAQIIEEAEGFCVDLGLAIAARLVENDTNRAEFVLHSVKSALRALAPESPTAIFVHPDDHRHLAHALEDLPVRDDDTLTPGTSRVEAGRLLVQSSLEEAFEQIRGAVLELKVKRQASARRDVEGGLDASDG